MIVSPGPCTPDQAGISLEAVRRFPAAKIPTLGVCLGHQALVQAWGGKIIRHQPVHGKTTKVQHDGRTIFAGLPTPFVAGRYHSLVADPDLPAELELSASLGDSVDPSLDPSLAHADAVRSGPIVSTDLFYDGRGLESEWSRAGALAVEMEAATLFTVGGRHDVPVGCVLAVSDQIVAGNRERIGDRGLLAAAEAMGAVAVAALGR